MKIFEAGGRPLTYEIWGPLSERAVLFFHGFPGSHTQASFLGAKWAASRGPLVACDRPGYGGTGCFSSEIEYLECVRTLLDTLGVRRFEILGVSGGAPWAHLMASRFAEEVQGLRILCGLGSYNRETAKFFAAYQRIGLWCRRWGPEAAASPLLGIFLRELGSKSGFEKMLGFLAPVDRETLRAPEHRTLLLESMREAGAQGAAGVLADTSLYSRDWLREDCDLERLRSVPIFYSHGLNDHVLNHRLSVWMNQVLPHSKLQLFEGEGHYSLPFRKGFFLMDVE